MTRPDDETLMAYADNALDAAERAAVDARLATDQDLRARLDALRAQNAALQAAFGDVMQTPPPEALVDLIMTAPSTAHARSAVGTVVPFERRRSIWSQPRHVLPLAASLLLAVGLGVLAGRGGSGTGDSQIALGPLSSGSTLARVLEADPTGVARDGLVVVATFRDRSGRVCREFERLGGADGSLPLAAAVACRGGDGIWTTEGAARIAAKASTPGFTPSGTPERDALEGLLSMLGAGPALEPAAEAALRANGWRP
jgi:hypothetical protein